MGSLWGILFWILAYSVEPGEAALKLLMKPCTDVCNVQADATMNIRCSLPNDVTAFSFQWYLFNGLKTIDMKKETNQSHIETHVSSSLQYNASRAHHGWNLYCSAETIHGYLESQKSSLNVLYLPTRPQFRVDANVIIGNHLNAIDGQTVVVECDVDSNPPSGILWEHDSEIVSENKTLVLHNVNQTDAGKYFCFARNTLSLASGETHTRSYRSDLHITVWHPPIVPEVTYEGVIIDNGIVKVIYKRPIVLECRSDGKPPPSIHWEYNTNCIVNSTRIELTDQRSGTITCVAENLIAEIYDQSILGRSKKSIYVDVLPVHSGSSQNSDLLLPLIGAGCGTLLLLAATVLVCVCTKWKMRENSVAKKDIDEIVENPMYISADDVLAHEPSIESQAVEDVVENPMHISADDIGRKKVASEVNAKCQIGQSETNSVPYTGHKFAPFEARQYSSEVDTVVDEEDTHYEEIIDESVSP